MFSLRKFLPPINIINVIIGDEELTDYFYDYGKYPSECINHRSTYAIHKLEPISKENLVLLAEIKSECTLESMNFEDAFNQALETSTDASNGIKETPRGSSTDKSGKDHSFMSNQFRLFITNCILADKRKRKI